MTEVVEFPIDGLWLQIHSLGSWIRNPPPYVQAQVTEYAERIKAGEDYPPVWLTPDGGIINGHRRIWAAYACGATTIRAIIIGIRAARVLNWLRNAAHGLVHHHILTAALMVVALSHHHRLLRDAEVKHAAWASFNGLPGHAWSSVPYLAACLLVIAAVVWARRA